MSADRMIEVIQELLSVHLALNHQAKEKTDYLKDGDIEGLEALIKKEETTVSRLEELEKRRIHEVNEFLSKKGIPAGDLTISELLKFVDPQEQLELLELQHSLLKETTTLKQRNALNQELIEQSLQFINVSLNLFDPYEETANYRHPDQMKEPERRRRSLFDSKA